MTSVACSSRPAATLPPAALVDALGTTPTSRAELLRTIATMDARLERNDADAAAAVRLADALLRQTRVTGNGGLAIRAETVLRRVLHSRPGDVDVRRMLGAVLLSQHRFVAAREEAQRGLDHRPDDAWMWGVLGDAHLELGEYDQAFAAFDRMLTLRPNAASYARASYARELSGDLDGAVRFMTMALDATSAHDPESLAWHRAQLGHLQVERGRVADAEREYAHALAIFERHPLAAEGLARVRLAQGHAAAGLEIVMPLLAEVPTPPLLALAGDLLRALGRADEAERHYRLAEAAWESDAPDPSQLALFLADRGRRLDDAVRLAERAATDRRDIVTAHALAWVYFKAGRGADAQIAIARALRTGSRDRVLRAHAAAIAAGQTTGPKAPGGRPQAAGHRPQAWGCGLQAWGVGLQALGNPHGVSVRHQVVDARSPSSSHVSCEAGQRPGGWASEPARGPVTRWAGQRHTTGGSGPAGASVAHEVGQ
jgi:tetratricopeptide (TPR) repeat protein